MSTLTHHPDESAATTPHLARVLGRTHLLTLGIGAIIGSGIFVAPGIAAARYAGPALVLSLAGAAVACALAGLCYAELATLFPVAGSAYAYARRVFGRFPGWIIGWFLVLEYLFATSILAVGWSGYLSSLIGTLGGTIPTLHTMLGPLDVPAMLVLGAACLVAGRNVRISASIGAGLVFIKVGIILLVIVCALPFVEPRNWHPFVPPNTGHWGEFGISGVLRGTAMMFYVYLGFDTVSIAAQEARHPQRDVPFGIMGSLVICTLLFIPFVLVLTGLTSYRALDVAQPTAVAIAAVAPHLIWLQQVVAIGAVVGMFSVLIVVLMALSRILYAMSLDGLVPSIFGRISARSQAPVAGTVAATIVGAVMAALLPMHLLTQLVSVGALVAFSAASMSVLVLRRTHPALPRAFRVPWVPFIPYAR